jgi:hypothetical protein
MLKMKYLLALVLVALCVSFASSVAVAQDSWAVVVWDDDEDEDTPDVPNVDLPIGMGWAKTYDATVVALNDGTTSWDKASGYQLLSVEGTTETGLTLTDRWGFSAVDLIAADLIAPDDEKEWAFTITAPPISGLFDCKWVMGVSGAPINTALAWPWVLGDADEDEETPDVAVPVPVLITRFPDTCGGTAGAWAASQIEGCAGRVPFIVQGYADGLYRPGIKVTRDQMAVFIRRAMKIAQVFPDPAEYDEEEDEWTFYNTFPDVPYYGPGDSRNNWAVGDIEALAATMVDDDNDEDTDPVPVVAGFGDGTYQPTWDVYRSQMAKFIALGGMVPMYTDDELDAMMDPEDEAYDPDYFAFPDVPYGYWADNFVYALRDAGIVLGYTDGLYRPGNPVDRGQLAVYCYRAFIAPTTEVVVLGGPGATDVDLTTVPDWHGWTSAAVDPDWAYLEFDAAAVGPELAGAGTWDIVFYFGPMATPTDTPETVPVEDTAGVSLDAADLTGVTGTYFTAAAKIPVMTSGEKLMWATVETATGGVVQLGRTVQFEQLEPPPPPGAPRPPNSLGGATWPDLAEDSRPEAVAFSGSFANMKYSDNSYYVLDIPTYPMVDGVDWTDCCSSSGATLKWTGLEIPVGATEMKLTLEYHIYDPEDQSVLSQNNMPCANMWCTSDYNNMCEEWGSPWIDGVHVNYGFGLVMVNYNDAWDWTNAEIQDTPAEGGYLGAFAYHPTTDMVMTWTVNDWTDFVKDGEAAIHFCGGTMSSLWIDQCMLEFNPH